MRLFSCRSCRSVVSAAVVVGFGMVGNAQISVAVPKVPPVPKVEVKVNKPVITAPPVPKLPLAQIPVVSVIPTPNVKSVLEQNQKEVANAVGKVGDAAAVHVNGDFADKVAAILQEKGNDPTGAQFSKGKLLVDCIKHKGEKTNTCTFKPDLSAGPAKK